MNFLNIKSKLTILTLSILTANIAFAENAAHSDESATNSDQVDSSATHVLKTIVVVGSSAKTGSNLTKQPLSASVITAKQISDAGAKRLDSALAYESGVLSQPYGADTKQQWFKIRGFDASTTLDGTALAPYGYFVWDPVAYGVEAVEVVKGANSFNYGATQAGGNVNLVTKRPGMEEKGELNLGAGNLNQRNISADYTGFINGNDALRYRLVGSFDQSDSQIAGDHMKNYYFAPSFTWDVSDATHLTLLGSYTKKDGVPTNGFMPAYGSLINTPFGKIAQSTNLGEPTKDRLNVDQYSLGYEFSHNFSDTLKFTQNYRWSKIDNYLLNTFAYASDGNRTAYRGYTFTDGISETHTIDNRLIKDFNFGQFKNKVMLGVDYYRNTIDGVNNGFGAAPSIDMFDPIHNPNFSVTADPMHLKTEQLGFYLSNQMNWNDLIDLNLGIRHDNAKSDANQAGVVGSYDKNKTTYTAGLMYHVAYGISPYINYSTSFRPLTGVGGNGETYKPYEGKQYEAGIKYAPDWLRGDITVAYFDLTEKNALIANSSNVSVQAGERKNKGVEVQANVRVNDNISTQLAYTHNDSKLDLSVGNTIRTPAIPNDQFSGRINYKFITDNVLNGLKLGAGIRYVGSTNDAQYYPGYKVGSYTLYDLMASYPLDKQLDLQVNATNLSNEKYVSACDFYCYYGAARSVNVKVTYKW